MIRQDWTRDYIILLRKGQERDITMLDPVDDYWEIDHRMTDSCAAELMDIAQRARKRR